MSPPTRHCRPSPCLNPLPPSPSPSPSPSRLLRNSCLDFSWQGQELAALSGAQLLCGLAGALPPTGVFVRTSGRVCVCAYHRGRSEVYLWNYVCADVLYVRRCVGVVVCVCNTHSHVHTHVSAVCVSVLMCMCFTYAHHTHTYTYSCVAVWLSVCKS